MGDALSLQATFLHFFEDGAAMSLSEAEGVRMPFAAVESVISNHGKAQSPSVEIPFDLEPDPTRDCLTFLESIDLTGRIEVISCEQFGRDPIVPASGPAAVGVVLGDVAIQQLSSRETRVLGLGSELFTKLREIKGLRAERRARSIRGRNFLDGHRPTHRRSGGGFSDQLCVKRQILARSDPNAAEEG